jgi:hypothetical protein
MWIERSLFELKMEKLPIRYTREGLFLLCPALPACTVLVDCHGMAYGMDNARDVEADVFTDLQ